MSLLHALMLGLVQGLTEFLPISSSGHLALVPWLFGWDDFGGDPALEDAFDVALHLGTLIGAVTYLRVDVVRYAGAGLRWIADRGRPEGDARTAWMLVVATLPTAAIGLVVAGVESDPGDRTWLVAVTLIAFGVALWVADRLPGTMSMADLSLGRAALLGVAQGLAFQPGVSRSGVVITVARGMRVERAEAARLSFLMALPVITGAGLL